MKTPHLHLRGWRTRRGLRSLRVLWEVQWDMRGSSCVFCVCDGEGWVSGTWEGQEGCLVRHNGPLLWMMVGGALCNRIRRCYCFGRVLVYRGIRGVEVWCAVERVWTCDMLWVGCGGVVCYGVGVEVSCAMEWV